MANTILAIDIGSTKVTAVIAEIDDYGHVTITGHGLARSQGVKKGVITNIELASKSIKKALNDARRIAGNNISVATVSISSAYARSENSKGVITIPDDKDISIKEIQRVMEAAIYNITVPNEYEVIHVLPYKFKVNDQDYIDDPYGMNANRIEVNVNIIMVQKSSLNNLKKAVSSAGIEIEGVVINSYASAISTMKEDEKELGVAVVDMGGQTSSLIVHVGNSVRYNDFLGVGSNHITNDLSMALHTPLNVAEEVKRRYGNLMEISSETIELPVIGDEDSKNSISLEIVHGVIAARVEEALMILSKSLEKSGLKDQIGAGVVLTGGMTKLKGIRELAQAIFHGMPVRVAWPRELGGLFRELNDPSYSTVIGLLLYRSGLHTQYEVDNNKQMLHNKEEGPGLRDIDLGGGHGEEQPSHNTRTPKIGNTPQHDESSSASHHQSDDGIGGFNFDNLPKPDKGSGNMINKLYNWAKQLF